MLVKLRYFECYSQCLLVNCRVPFFTVFENVFNLLPDISLLTAYLPSLILCVSYHCSQILEFSFTYAVEDEECIVCPNDSCNYLYRFNEKEKCKVCTATIFGEKCGEDDKRLAFAEYKWCPYKVYYFIPPSQYINY